MTTEPEPPSEPSPEPLPPGRWRTRREAASRWSAAPAWAGVGVLLTAIGIVIPLIASGGSSDEPRATPPATTTPETSAPFTVTLVYDKGHVDNGGGVPGCGGRGQWVFDKPIDSVPAPADPAQLDETWAHDNGGVDYRQTAFKLVVQGTGTSAVTLLGLRVIDVTRSPGIAGPAIYSQLGCGEPTKATGRIILDVPHTGPLLDFEDKSFPFTTTTSDVVHVQVRAGFTPRDRPGQECGCVIGWRLALDWAYQGQQGKPIVIDDEGQPFQTQDGAVTGVYITGNAGTWLRAE